MMLSLTSCHATACQFPFQLAAPVLSFELLILLGTIGLYTFFWRSWNIPRLWQKLAIMMTGVFIFEFFTSPMWNNYYLGSYAYVYRDVSWILSIGWTAMIFTVVTAADRFMASSSALRRFIVYLISLLGLSVLFESWLVADNVRSYSPEVMEAMSGVLVGNVHIEILYYVPVFLTLIIGFYKYWELYLNNEPVLPMKKVPFLRNLVISTAVVLIYELMIEPMVLNTGLPSWSYLHRDVSILMTGLWIVIIWLSIWWVDVVLIHWNLVKKFVAYVALAGLISLPVESWLISNGYRQYGPSSVANFSGFTTPITGVAIEVAFAIPFYLSLVIATIKFWQIVMDTMIGRKKKRVPPPLPAQHHKLKKTKPTAVKKRVVKERFAGAI